MGEGLQAAYRYAIEKYMKKTVLFLLDKYEYSGVTTLTKQYIELLQDQYNCIILGFINDIDDPDSFFPKAKVFIIKKEFKRGLIGKAINSIRYIIAINTIYQKHKIDIVHFSTTLSGISAFFHCATWKKKKIATFHGAHDLEEISIHGTGVIKNIKNVIRKKLQQFILKRSTVIVLSEYAYKLIRSHYSFYKKQNIFIIPPYIKMKNQIKKIKKSNEFIIVNFGRAEPRKGIHTLLEAIKNLRRRYTIKTYIATPISYWHMGIIKTYEALNLYTSVHILHKINDAQKQDLLRKAHLFVMPSKDLETFGISMLESLSTGTPVVGTPSGAILEILSKIDRRLIAKEISSVSLANTIAWYINLSFKEKKKIRNKCLSYVETYHAKKTIKKYFLQVYKYC